MRKIIILTTFILCSFINKLNSDTFSIVAVDPATGQVGCTAASCYPASITFASDLHPGIGVIITQAAWSEVNQNYARLLMQMGLSPQQIIDSLIAHDEYNSPKIRQYGIVDLINGGRSAAFTGSACQNWKGHFNGQTFSVQGNCLLGQQIIDSMKSRFLSAEGQLAIRLMASLQGANIIGADNRCFYNNTSSLAAFIRVAKPTDPPNGPFYLDLDVPNTVGGRDPIDSLQTLFDMWLITGLSGFSNKVPLEFALHQNYPNPFNPTTKIRFDITGRENVKTVIHDVLGNEIAEIVNVNDLPAGSYSTDFDASNLASGVYVCRMITDLFTDAIKMILVK